MFTGIIQDMGTLNKLEDSLYEVTTNLDLSNCKEGSSISCNGVCLTAINIFKNKNFYIFNVNIGEETMNRTNLSNYLNNKKRINIEKSLTIGDEIGGHFVYGHVDSVTTLIKIVKLKNSWEYHFKKDFGNNNKFISEKASISINGISLTIANVFENSFNISVIDHTFKKTNLQFLKLDDRVNIEYDYLARFILNND
tara:strand:+ start:206 stop:793 length:588 start_codon:yes stop_codon:yes gene_type:complete